MDARGVCGFDGPRFPGGSCVRSVGIGLAWVSRVRPGQTGVAEPDELYSTALKVKTEGEWLGESRQVDSRVVTGVVGGLRRAGARRSWWSVDAARTGEVHRMRPSSRAVAERPPEQSVEFGTCSELSLGHGIHRDSVQGDQAFCCAHHGEECAFGAIRGQCDGGNASVLRFEQEVGRGVRRG